MTAETMEKTYQGRLMVLAAIAMALGLFATVTTLAQDNSGNIRAPLAPMVPGNSVGLNKVAPPPALLSRLDKESGVAVISGRVYRLPVGVRVMDRNGAIRSRDYLKPGMNLRYQSDGSAPGPSERPTVTEIEVLSYNPEAVVH